MKHAVRYAATLLPLLALASGCMTEVSDIDAAGEHQDELRGDYKKLDESSKIDAIVGRGSDQKCFYETPIRDIVSAIPSEEVKCCPNSDEACVDLATTDQCIIFLSGFCAQSNEVPSCPFDDLCVCSPVC